MKLSHYIHSLLIIVVYILICSMTNGVRVQLLFLFCFLFLFLTNLSVFWNYFWPLFSFSYILSSHYSWLFSSLYFPQFCLFYKPHADIFRKIYCYKSSMTNMLLSKQMQSETLDSLCKQDIKLCTPATPFNKNTIIQRNFKTESPFTIGKITRTKTFNERKTTFIFLTSLCRYWWSIPGFKTHKGTIK